MTTKAPVGPLLVLAALVTGIVAGGHAGPGTARLALASGCVGVTTAACVADRGDVIDVNAKAERVNG